MFLGSVGTELRAARRWGAGSGREGGRDRVECNSRGGELVGKARAFFCLRRRKIRQGMEVQ